MQILKCSAYGTVELMLRPYLYGGRGQGAAGRRVRKVGKEKAGSREIEIKYFAPSFNIWQWK